MTHRAGRPGTGIPRIWLLPILGVTVLLGVTAAGVLSRSVILDLVAWWPVWLLVAILTFLARGKRLGRVKVPGLVPLLATAALVVFVVGHVQGWQAMPSTTRALVGPPLDSIQSASLAASIDGEIRVERGGDHLYQVRPIRTGGSFGLPDAIEESQESLTSVRLVASAEPGFHSFGGWDILVNPYPTWSLSLRGHVEADLRGLRVTEADISGEGMVMLGTVETTTPVELSGVFELTVPEGVPVRLVGRAAVPTTWKKLSDGWRGPTVGQGWVVTIADGSSVTATGG